MVVASKSLHRSLATSDFRWRLIHRQHQLRPSSAGTWRTTNPVSLPGGGFQIGQKMALWQRIS